MNSSTSPLPDDRLHELHELATASLNEELSDEQVVRLDRLVCEDEEFRRHYIRYMYVSWNLRTWAKFPLTDNSDDRLQTAPPDADAILLEQLAETQSIPAVGFPMLGVVESTQSGRSGFFFQGVPLAYLVASVVFAIGLLVGSLVPVSHSFQLANRSLPVDFDSEAARTIVGRITGMADCRWSQRGRPPYGYDFVSLGREFQLDAGLLEITYDTGATVILEGPATYTVESPMGGFLSVGKLTAKVENKGSGGRGQGSGETTSLPSPTRGAGGEGSEKNGDRSQSETTLTLALSQGERGPASRSSFLIPHSYFAVRTPTAIVTDLGTEFGVEVNREGATTSHVFRGSVSLQVASVDAASTPTPRVLHANESARVEESKDADGDSPRLTVTTSTAPSPSFVREIPKPTIKVIDLVDVASGGDGFSGRRHRGIDPATGKAHDSMPKPVLDVKDYTLGDRVYHRVDALPGVDGVFIPDGGLGPVTIDSAGHQFAGFPATSNQTAGIIWTGGYLHFDPPFEDIRTVMNGIDFAGPGHAVLYVQSNQGITFDLDVLRRANAGYRMVRFRTTAGNTEPASARGDAVYADIWVLVDGQMRFRRREVSGLNGAFSVVVPLSDTDRFLTLASTDGGNGIAWDQVLFGDPRVDMTPTNNRQIASPQEDAGEERR